MHGTVSYNSEIDRSLDAYAYEIRISDIYFIGWWSLRRQHKVQKNELFKRNEPKIIIDPLQTTETKRMLLMYSGALQYKGG